MIDETYIEMCRKAEEIQDLWEPKPGDQVIRTHTVFGEEIDRQIWDSMDHISILVQHSSVDSFIHATDSNGTTHVLKGSELEKRVYQWLPRQEDLQEIYFNNNEYVGDFYSEWLTNYALEFGLSERSSNDMTILLLFFIMRELYGKIWDFEEKKWIEDKVAERYGI